MLAFPEGKSVVVTSVLLTSTRALGSYPVSGLCSAKRPNQSPDCGAQGFVLFGGLSKDEEIEATCCNEKGTWSSKV